ncbi:protein MAIN-LIKE 1-like [Papaver somniferum]|uniref:protein MAIN-LIKE 1-like n=1 Tax=Papaver somniferum TaxID=3469 RepID=UPI000E70315C|nr:protein MAIN-LIKE 1-like [Papaver somniferum]XP_026406638.1 protein MAIN-LIKE 1-like [Papaver somniferum]
MVRLGPGEPPKGTPADGGNVLFGYKDSWACQIHNTFDHKHAIRLMRRQTSCSMTKNWDLEDECEEVKLIVKNSGLWTAVESSNIEHYRVTLYAFCERFYGETDTMLFPFREMAITPNDAHQILGLEFEEKAVSDGFDSKISWENIFELTRDLFGWNQVRTESVLEVKDGHLSKKFNLRKLKDALSGTKKIFDEEGMVDLVRINATAAGYLLYVLGKCIFLDSSESSVDAKYVQLLHPLNEMHEYSWGTTVVSFLNNELTKASRALTAQVDGNICLFQVILLCKSFIFGK